MSLRRSSRDFSTNFTNLRNKQPEETRMGNNFAAEFKAAHPEEIGADGVIKVCIGGGAGFIGSHIAKKLMAEVVSYRGLNRLHVLCPASSIVMPLSLFSGLLRCLRRLEGKRVHETRGVLQ